MNLFDILCTAAGKLNRWPSIDIKYIHWNRIAAQQPIKLVPLKLDPSKVSFLFLNFKVYSLYMYLCSSICLKERICGYMHKVDRDGSKEKWKCIWQNSKEGAAKMKSTTAETFSSLANLSKTLTTNSNGWREKVIIK